MKLSCVNIFLLGLTQLLMFLVNCETVSLDYDTQTELDFTKIIEQIVLTVGTGKQGVSSYLQYLANTCPQHVNTFNPSQRQTGQLGEVGKNYWSCFLSTSKSKHIRLPHISRSFRKSPKLPTLTEEQKWENFCTVWPIMKTCHGSISAPAIDRCYLEQGQMGSDALSFTNAFVEFQCSNVNRTVESFELKSTKQLLCFGDVKEHVVTCAKRKIYENINLDYNFCRYLSIVKDCFEDERKKSVQCDENPKVVSYINDMLGNIRNSMLCDVYPSLKEVFEFKPITDVESTLPRQKLKESQFYYHTD